VTAKGEGLSEFLPLQEPLETKKAQNCDSKSLSEEGGGPRRDEEEVVEAR
jgi:hypothetical protein